MIADIETKYDVIRKRRDEHIVILAGVVSRQLPQLDAADVQPMLVRLLRQTYIDGSADMYAAVQEVLTTTLQKWGIDT